ncbi:MAG: hypothetical protein K1X65_13240 [Caldilineales bacterium]|nr:hypothetical protein [Caldilineales bacterium]MCW5859421.1 hypothetical protein [Caldilineales bacterium]
MSTTTRSAPSGAVTGEWECDECGYTRRGSLRNRPIHCPECGAPGDAFSFWSDDDEDDDLDDWDDDEEEWDEDEEEWQEDEEEDY